MTLKKPALLMLDEQPKLLQTIEYDLLKLYGAHYRVVRAESDSAALWSLKKMRLRNEPIALFLVPQTMREMTGVEFLSRAMKVYPETKRVLLAACGDTNTATRAINQAILHRCVIKPWEPAEERIVPVLTPLLKDWHTSCDQQSGDLRLIGHRWSHKCCRLKEFLARSDLPHRWLDIERDFEEAHRLMDYAGATDFHLPLVLFSNGRWLMRPTIAKLAKRVAHALENQSHWPVAAREGGR